MSQGVAYFNVIGTVSMTHSSQAVFRCFQQGIGGNGQPCG